MSNKPKFTAPMSPFHDETPAGAYEQTYGNGALNDLPDSGRIVAKPTSIFAWRPDLRQPRRAIPANVRGDWTGNPDDLPVLLAQWIEQVETRAGMTIPIEKAVRGEWERPAMGEDPDVSTLIDLIDLAASIYKDGLINPMRGASGMIESGERRWLAYHLLHMFSGKDYSKIPTIEKDAVDVWAQAAENGSRTPLNAIGMARQIALLIMAMYEGDAGVKFDRFETLVLPGGSDRAFYAQVANGEVYRIKRGLGERVLNVTGLKTMDYVRRFRALLSIPDALWVKADVQSWTEWQIRDYVDNAKASNSDVTQLHSVTDVTPSPTQPPPAEGKDILATPKPRAVGGLYVDPTPMREAQRAMVSGRIGNDDDFDDDDGFEEDEYQPPAQDYPQARTTESTTAFARVWDGQGNKIVPVLELLRSLTDNREVKMRLTELLTLAPSDVVRLLEGTRQGWWNQYVQESIALVEPIFRERVANALNEFVMHLKQEGDYLTDKYNTRG